MDNRRWYWVAATVKGRNVLVSPPKETEEAARDYARQMLGNALYTIEELGTKDQTEATRRFRHRLLGRTGDLEMSISRMKHKINEVRQEQSEDQIENQILEY